MNYSDISNAWTALLEEAPSPYTLPTDMATLMPRAIEYATNRICREMILLAERQQVSTLTFTGGSRSLDLSTLNPACLVVEGIAAITPQGDAPTAGTRWQFDPASLDTIDFIWPTETITASPATSETRRFAMKDDHTVVVCPTPDAAYTAEVTGLFQLPYINASAPTSNYLTVTYPELFLAAGMVWWAGYQRDFAPQPDSPGFAQYWEAQYKTLLGPAIDEETRRRGLKAPDGSQSRVPAQTPA